MVTPLHHEPVVDEHAAPGGAVVPAGPRAVEQRHAAAVAHIGAPSAQDRAGQAARRVPYLAGLGTGAAGTGALALVEATASVNPALSGAIALGTCAASAGTVLALRVHFRDRRDPRTGFTVERIPRAHRGRWWGAAWLHMLWVDAMALGAVDTWLGPLGMAAILGGGTAALAARWMREHPVALPTDAPPPPAPAPPPAFAPPPAPPEPDEGDLLREKWETRVAAGPRAIVPGSELGDDREDLPYGFRWVVQLDPTGGVGASKLDGLVADVALALQTKVTHVDFNRLEGAADREDRALLTVITRDVLAEGIAYLGPRYEDGRIPLGQYADGSGQPYWIARDDTGPQPGMVTGGQGSGKSVLLTQLGMAMRDSREWLVVFADGDEQGRSAPGLKQAAWDFAKGADEVLEQLAAVEAWMHQRGIDMGALTEDADGRPVPMTAPGRQEPAGKVLPCRAYPGLVWIFDEFHRLARALGRGFVDRVARVLRFGRKLGVTLIVGTQSALVADFGGLDEFRGMLAQGNATIMRTKNRSEANVVADFGVDPSTLPKGGGYFVIEVEDGRKALARTEDPKKGMSRWLRGLAPYQPDELPARVYAHKRPPKAADPVADFHETQRRQAAVQAALEAGEPLPWELEDQQPGGQPVAPVGGDGVAAPRQAPPDDDPSRWTMGGVGVPDVPLGDLIDLEARRAAAAPVAGPPLHWKAQKLLELLAADPDLVWSSAELAKEAELSAPDVSNFGRLLLERGAAHRPTGKIGRWQHGPGPRERSAAVSGGS